MQNHPQHFHETVSMYFGKKRKHWSGCWVLCKRCQSWSQYCGLSRGHLASTLSAPRLFVWSSFYFLACLIPSRAHKQQSGQTAVSTCTLGRGGTLVILTITSSNIYYCSVDTCSEDHHWMFNVGKLNCSFWSLVTHKNECKTSKAGVKHLICVPFVESGAYVCPRHH